MLLQLLLGDVEVLKPARYICVYVSVFLFCCFYGCAAQSKDDTEADMLSMCGPGE